MNINADANKSESQWIKLHFYEFFRILQFSCVFPLFFCFNWTSLGPSAEMTLYHTAKFIAAVSIISGMRLMPLPDGSWDWGNRF